MKDEKKQEDTLPLDQPQQNVTLRFGVEPETVRRDVSEFAQAGGDTPKPRRPRGRPAGSKAVKVEQPSGEQEQIFAGLEDQLGEVYIDVWRVVLKRQIPQPEPKTLTALNLCISKVLQAYLPESANKHVPLVALALLTWGIVRTATPVLPKPAGGEDTVEAKVKFK